MFQPYAYGHELFTLKCQDVKMLTFYETFSSQTRLLKIQYSHILLNEQVHSEKCVFRCFCHCTNIMVYLHKLRWLCCHKVLGPSLTEELLWGVWLDLYLYSHFEDFYSRFCISREQRCSVLLVLFLESNQGSSESDNPDWTLMTSQWQLSQLLFVRTDNPLSWWEREKS
jgi:hypothetical protein